MAATIIRRCCKMHLCINGIKNLQLHYPALSKAQNYAVLKDFHRSSWYRSFFGTTNQAASKTDSEKTSDPSPTKPKKPANVFLVYLQSVQDSIKQANPGIKRQQIVTEAAKQWKELDPEEKSRIAMERKERYEKYKMEKMDYIENMTPEQIETEGKEKEKKTLKKLKKARKHLGMPDRPWSSYKWFLSEKFAERSDESVQTFFKQAKDIWNELPESQKEVYNQKHRDSQGKYQAEMASWEESMIEAGRFDVLRKSTLDKLKQREGKKRESKKRNTVIE